MGRDEVYRDLMQAFDAALTRHTWMDSSRLGATGGSYGGYMTNWIAGHSDRFDALVTSISSLLSPRSSFGTHVMCVTTGHRPFGMFSAPLVRHSGGDDGGATD